MAATRPWSVQLWQRPARRIAETTSLLQEKTYFFSILPVGRGLDRSFRVTRRQLFSFFSLKPLSIHVCFDKKANPQLLLATRIHGA